MRALVTVRDSAARRDLHAARGARSASRWSVRALPGPALAAIYLSMLVLVPVATMLSHAFTGGLLTMWSSITDAETLASIRLALECSVAVVALNSALGLVIAWQLVRDRYFLNPVISAVVDLPFALPTIVAGAVLLSLYGPASPFHINVAFSRWSLILALAFVTMPFAVRSVQPVLEALDTEVEEAAASLGASGWTTFRRVVVPSLAPALLSGAGLAFARAVGEYGSISLISGNVPFKIEVASVRIYGLIQSDDLPAAAATSLALCAITLAVLGVLSFYRRHLAKREGGA